MKLFLFAVAAVLTLANVATAARAFTSNDAVLARVPFNFIVGHDQLPSGTYTIRRNTFGLVTMKSVDRRFTVTVTTTFEPDLPKGDKLVFRRYGDRYFLGKVSATAFSADFPLSKLEKTIRYQDGQTIAESQRSIHAR